MQFLGIFKEFVEGPMKIDFEIMLNITLNQIKNVLVPVVKSCFGTKMRSICVIPKCPP